MTVISGSHSGLLSRSRPKSAYCGVATATNEPLENAQDEVEKPILRRERTFDLDPKPNTASKIVEVNIDIEPEAENDSGNQVDHNNIQQEEGKAYWNGQDISVFSLFSSPGMAFTRPLRPLATFMSSSLAWLKNTRRTTSTCYALKVRYVHQGFYLFSNHRKKVFRNRKNFDRGKFDCWDFWTLQM